MAVEYCSVADVRRVSGVPTSSVSDADVEAFIEEAQDWIENATHRYFGTSRDVTDRFNGNQNEYQQNNYDAFVDLDYNLNWNQGGILAARTPFWRDSVKLTQYPVKFVKKVNLLYNTVQAFSYVLTYIDATTTFTDVTEDINSETGDYVYPLGSTVAADNAIYFGMANKFEKLFSLLGVTGDSTGGVNNQVEYWNGSAWTELTYTESAPDTTQSEVHDFTNSGFVEWDAPKNWQTTTVNGNSAYWIRIRHVSASYSVSPQISHAYPQDVVRTEVELKNVRTTPGGNLYLMNNPEPYGIQNVKVSYNVGRSSVPYNVRQLTASIAALGCLINMIGGSFDDVTSYSIPDMSVSKGEPYTNVRAAIRELENRIFGINPGERGKYGMGLLELVGREVRYFIT